MFTGGDFPDESRPGVGEEYSRMGELELRDAVSELGKMQSNLIADPTANNWIELMRTRESYMGTCERAARNLAESPAGSASQMLGMRDGLARARHAWLYKALALKPITTSLLRRHRLARVNEMLTDGMFTTVETLTEKFDYHFREGGDGNEPLLSSQIDVAVRLLMECVGSELDIETHALVVVGLRKERYQELRGLGVPLSNIYE